MASALWLAIRKLGDKAIPTCSLVSFCYPFDTPDPSRLEYDDPVFVESGSQFSSQLELHSSPGYQPLLQLKQQEYEMAYQVIPT